jgi:phage terminase large subunit-like protein
MTGASGLATLIDTLDDLDAEQVHVLAREAWAASSRPEQRLPVGGWRVWYLQGGRGSGKTRAGAEAFTEWLEDDRYVGEWGVIGPTYGDARDVCIEGPSGLIRALGPSVENWNRSLGELRLTNGSVVWADGADDGALRIQGKNLSGAWCDEIGLWRRWETAWHESLAFAVRKAPARIIATGTPKAGHGLVALLVADSTVPKSRLRTRDNLANLSAEAVTDLEARYAGTRRGLQELEGELIDDVEGALWSAELIDANRLATVVPENLALRRVVVAVDPPGGATEAGIVVAALGAGPCPCGSGNDHGYVLEDVSLAAPPSEWGAVAVSAYHRHQADRLVAERNFGADMVEHVIETVDRSVAFALVNASRGKQQRAEPVVALYEQGRVHHVGRNFVDLEREQTEWVPGETPWSPNRVDALVWAITELMLDTVGGPAGLAAPAARSLPSAARPQRSGQRVGLAGRGGARVGGGGGRSR